MAADNKLELNLSQDLTTGVVEVKSNKAVSFSIALNLYLTSLKGIKDNLIAQVSKSSKEDLIKLAFGEAYQKQMKEQLPEEEKLKELVLTKIEEEAYDMLNISVSNFLDSEFPRVNDKLSLTEEAAAAAGLDRTASDEDLVKAEMDFINDNPEAAAQCQELQPTEVKNINIEEGPVS